jgi:hypothetical protein
MVIPPFIGLNKNPIQKNPPNDDGMTTAETDKG